MLYRLLLLLLLALTVSMLPWAQSGKAEAPTTGKAAAPTGKAAAPTGMEKFAPSQAISVDNAVAFPVDI
jgi:hypothetical protein